MLLNAFVHRDYAASMVQLRVMDDRISIWNPGELPNGLTVEMLHQEHESIPRNAVVADVCYKVGYIDSWGQGVKRMTESCAASGLEQPHIEERSGGVYVELQKVRQEEDTASGNRREDVGKASGKRRENGGDGFGLMRSKSLDDHSGDGEKNRRERALHRTKYQQFTRLESASSCGRAQGGAMGSDSK